MTSKFREGFGLEICELILIPLDPISGNRRCFLPGLLSRGEIPRLLSSARDHDLTGGFEEILPHQFFRPNGLCHPDRSGGISSLMIRKSGKPGISVEGLQPSALSRDEIPRLRSSARDDIWLRSSARDDIWLRSSARDDMTLRSSARDDIWPVAFMEFCRSIFPGRLGHVIPTNAEGSHHK